MSLRIRRALIAVSDKADLVDFARRLGQLGIEIVSTGGTAAKLASAKLSVTEVEEVTRFPEILGGRVKTLHPHIHGGILARREHAEDLDTLSELKIEPIDLVVVNLYPFEQAVDRGLPHDEIIEQIDIGGPAMIRAAAKNYRNVLVVVQREQYSSVLEELEENEGSISQETLERFARTAFARTAAYEASISNWFGQQVEGRLPDPLTEQWQRKQELRYGENPHQEASWYERRDGHFLSLARCELHLGDKEISYNNLLDTAAAAECALNLESPGAVVVKHCLPCGAAEGSSLVESYEAAVAGDPLSAYGGILALNGEIDGDLARRIANPERFFEVIYATKITDDALELIRTQVKWGRNCRFFVGGLEETGARALELRSIPGGVLVQEGDHRQAEPSYAVVTEREPTESEWFDLKFAWRVVPYVRSNAILLAQNRQLVGVGSGQPSRVDAVDLACRKAGERSRGAALASDAFFPFADGVARAVEAGVSAVIQPGGSRRDAEVIELANEHDLTMVFTAERHFRH